MRVVKILFLAANPFNSNRLALDEEVREITTKINGSKYSDSLVLETYWAVRPDDLLQTLNAALPNIVHFSGHGSEGAFLVLHSDNGNSTYISSAALTKLFQVLKDNVRVVVLNACYSEYEAQSIAKVIDCVIGMRNSIDDKAAIKFASSFYRAIGFGRSVQNAFDQGIASIALENLVGEEVPKLIVRKNIDPGKLFLTEYNDGSDILSDSNISELSEVSKIKPRRRKLDHVESLVNQSEYKLHRIRRADKGVGDHFLRNQLPHIVKSIRGKIRALSIIMGDIDELTIINKLYGKEVGNKVLLTVANILQVESKMEASGRCGDDTFYIFLPGLDMSEASRVAEELRVHIKTYSWASLAPGLRVTCCFGVSQLSKAEPPEDWIVRAVCGMIAAKGLGRNRTEIGPDYLPIRQSRELNHYFS